MSINELSVKINGACEKSVNIAPRDRSNGSLFDCLFSFGQRSIAGRIVRLPRQQSYRRNQSRLPDRRGYRRRLGRFRWPPPGHRDSAYSAVRFGSELADLRQSLRCDGWDPPLPAARDSRCYHFNRGGSLGETASPMNPAASRGRFTGTDSVATTKPALPGSGSCRRKRHPARF